MRALVRILAAALPLLIACSLLSAGPATITPVAGTPTNAAIATVPPPAVSGEAIQILEPGPGSRLVSPLNVRVQTTLPAFERTLTLRVLSDDGRDLIGPQAVVATSEEGGLAELQRRAALQRQRGAQRLPAGLPDQPA